MDLADVIDCTLWTFSIYAFHIFQFLGDERRADTGRGTYTEKPGGVSDCSVGLQGGLLMTPWNFWLYTHWGCLLWEAGDQTYFNLTQGFSPHPGSH